MGVTSLQDHHAGRLHETFTVPADRVPVEVRSHSVGTELARVGMDRWQVPATAVPSFIRAVITASAQHEDSDQALVIDLLDVLAAHGHGDPDEF